MRYHCLRKDSYRLEEYELTTIRYKDIFLIKDWRNDQIKILRQNNILTEKDQENYYNNIIINSIKQEKPLIILFSYLLSGECIGYGGLTNIDWTCRRAELSFLLDTGRVLNERQYATDFEFFLNLIKQVAFSELGFNRLFTETFDMRPLHVSILKKNGFVFEGRMRQHALVDGKFVDSLFHGCLKEDYCV